MVMSKAINANLVMRLVEPAMDPMTSIAFHALEINMFTMEDALKSVLNQHSLMMLRNCAPITAPREPSPTSMIGFVRNVILNSARHAPPPQQTAEVALKESSSQPKLDVSLTVNALKEPSLIRSPAFANIATATANHAQDPPKINAPNAHLPDMDSLTSPTPVSFLTNAQLRLLLTP